MLKVRTSFCLLACFLSSALSTFPSLANNNLSSNEVPVKAFTASYNILHKTDVVGTATRKLTALENGLFEYSYHNHIEWLIFSDDRKENSTLAINNFIVQPQSYEYKREGTGRDKFYQWTYDIANQSAYNVVKKKALTVDFSNNLQNKLSYHLQNRLDLIKLFNQNKISSLTSDKKFVYPVINTSGSIKDYVYQYDGEEEVMLPYGLVNTIKLKREIPEKKRITYAWFAPELNFLLVKLYQKEGRTEQFEAQLTTLVFE